MRGRGTWEFSPPLLCEPCLGSDFLPLISSSRWFAKNKDDGLIERELFPSFSGGVNWRLTIITGEERGAGTDSDVSVEIMGVAGKFGPYLLAAQKGGFETGMHDVFSVSTPDIGQVVELALSHNDKGFGAAWQVDSAELENMITGETSTGGAGCGQGTVHTSLPMTMLVPSLPPQAKNISSISRSGLTRPEVYAPCAAPVGTKAPA